nr:MAG TPA: amidotransferase class II [Caudoviricetes sp.]
MCGIVYSKNFLGGDVTKTILKRFEAQRTRGTTSFGFYVPERDQLTVNVKERRIKNRLKKNKQSEVLFHHRFSTSTVDVPSACHPFSTKKHWKNQYIGVHNGVIRNVYELEKEQKALGIEYVSRQTDGAFNDSEALIYDIARVLEGEKSEVKAEGSMAFIIIKKDEYGKPVNLFFGRNSSNPLVMKKTKYSLTLSSQGEGESIIPNTLYSYDYETGILVQRSMTFPSYSHIQPYCGSDYHYLSQYTANAEAREIIQASNISLTTGSLVQAHRRILYEAGHNVDKYRETVNKEIKDTEIEIRRIEDESWLVESMEAFNALVSYADRLDEHISFLNKLLRKEMPCQKQNTISIGIL